MARRFFKQLLPIGIIAGLIAANPRAGISGVGQVWGYSCTFSMGGSVGPGGLRGIAPSKAPGPLFYSFSTANLVNDSLGCN